MKTKLPTPQRLPSGQYRCQVMVAGKRVSVVDAAPDVCQAKAVALRAGLIEQLETPKDPYHTGRGNQQIHRRAACRSLPCHNHGIQGNTKKPLQVANDGSCSGY